MNKGIGIQFAVIVSIYVGTLGCSSGSTITIVPADGVVTYQGRALAGARVMFAPEKGPVAFGITDLEGKFELKTGTQRGVAVGPVTVAVTVPSDGEEDKIDPGIAKQPKNAEEAQAYMKRAGELQAQMAKNPQKKKEAVIPSKYSSTETSGLNFTVKPSAADNHFEIPL